MLETIRHNSKGYLVTAAKYLTGYCERGKADEYYDATFVAFVCSWQGKNGLTADGVIGAKSWAKLAENAPTCSTAKNKTSAATCAVQLLVGEGVHESTAALQTVVAALLALEVRLAIHGEGFCGVAVGQDDAATVVELHLAVLVVHGLLAANLHILGQQTGGFRWLHTLQDEHGVLGVLDVH